MNWLPEPAGMGFGGRWAAKSSCLICLQPLRPYAENSVQPPEEFNHVAVMLIPEKGKNAHYLFSMLSFHFSFCVISDMIRLWNLYICMNLAILIMPQWPSNFQPPQSWPSWGRVAAKWLTWSSWSWQSWRLGVQKWTQNWMSSMTTFSF